MILWRRRENASKTNWASIYSERGNVNSSVSVLMKTWEKTGYSREKRRSSRLSLHSLSRKWDESSWRVLSKRKYQINFICWRGASFSSGMESVLLAFLRFEGARWGEYLPQSIGNALREKVHSFCLTFNSLNQLVISEDFILVLRLIRAAVASSSVAVLRWLPMSWSFTGKQNLEQKILFSSNNCHSNQESTGDRSVYTCCYTFLIDFSFTLTSLPVCLWLPSRNCICRQQQMANIWARSRQICLLN